MKTTLRYLASADGRLDGCEDLPERAHVLSRAKVILPLLLAALVLPLCGCANSDRGSLTSITFADPVFYGTTPGAQPTDRK
jgi:hypothetical protein